MTPVTPPPVTLASAGRTTDFSRCVSNRPPALTSEALTSPQGSNQTGGL